MAAAFDIYKLQSYVLHVRNQQSVVFVSWPLNTVKSIQIWTFFVFIYQNGACST